MRKSLAFFRFAAADAVLLDAGRDRPAGGVRILFYNAVGCGILSSITRNLQDGETYGRIDTKMFMGNYRLI